MIELGPLITFLVGLFVLAIVIYVVKLILDMLPLPEPAKIIAYLIIGLVFLVLLFQMIGVHL